MRMRVKRQPLEELRATDGEPVQLCFLCLTLSMSKPNLVAVVVALCLFIQYVADAVQHSTLVREKMYDDIGWMRDHPVLLRVKLRFKGISTRVSEGCDTCDIGLQYRSNVTHTRPTLNVTIIHRYASCVDTSIPLHCK